MRQDQNVQDDWLDRLAFPEEDTAAWTDEAKAAEFDARLRRRRRPYIIGMRLLAAAAMLTAVFVGVKQWPAQPVETAVAPQAPVVTAQATPAAEPAPQPSLMAQSEPSAKPSRRVIKQKPVPPVETEPAEEAETPETAEEVMTPALPTTEELLADLSEADRERLLLCLAELEQQKETHRRQAAARKAQQQREMELVMALLAKEPAKTQAGTVIVQNS